MSHYWRPILFVLVFSLTLASGAHAGGLYLYEVGSPDVGLAGAGYAARADDAATVFTNPAGMTPTRSTVPDDGGPADVHAYRLQPRWQHLRE